MDLQSIKDDIWSALKENPKSAIFAVLGIVAAGAILPGAIWIILGVGATVTALFFFVKRHREVDIE